MNLRNIETKKNIKDSCNHPKFKFLHKTICNAKDTYVYECIKCKEEVKYDSDMYLEKTIPDGIFKELCDHEWVDDGRDSHHFYYKCVKCGDTDRV